MPKVKLSEGEIQGFIDDVAKVLNQVPLFYVYEVLETCDLRPSDYDDDDENNH